nr:MFS transporter [Gammaproteobacteria bacterium]
MAVANYFLLGFVPNFLNHEAHISLQKINLFITIGILLTVILIPICGRISDRIGRRPVMATGAVGFIILTYPFMQMLASGDSTLMLIAVIIYALVLAPVAALVPIAISEMFPFAVRCTGSAIGYNLALTIFGGTTPIVAQGLLLLTKSNSAPAWYISILALIHLLFILCSKETRGMHANC